MPTMQPQTEPFNTPPLVSFTGVKSWEIWAVWDGVKDFIESGMAEGESLDGLLERLTTKTCQLWIAHDDKNIIAACVTELPTIADRKVCNVISCGGTRMKEWLDISLPVIEGWANAHGAEMRFLEIRPGWAPILKKRGYKITKITMEKKHGQQY